MPFSVLVREAINAVPSPGLEAPAAPDLAPLVVSQGPILAPPSKPPRGKGCWGNTRQILTRVGALEEGRLSSTNGHASDSPTVVLRPSLLQGVTFLAQNNLDRL
uniref:Uncharacterized protein n=1 Tax=Leersia perrieri TaxID=77586 RepID=A0A0D9VYD4_9ORYZ